MELSTMSTSLNALALAGRLSLASLFILSGPGKITQPEATASYMAGGGLPEVAALATVVGVFEIAAGLALAAGYKTRLAALALAVFTLVAAVLFHGYWSVAADQQFMQQLLFMKNVGVVGGLITVAAFGAGQWSLDSRRLATTPPVLRTGRH